MNNPVETPTPEGGARIVKGVVFPGKEFMVEKYGLGKVGSLQFAVSSEEEVGSGQIAVCSKEKKVEEVGSLQFAVSSEEEVGSGQFAVCSKEKKVEEVGSLQSTVCSKEEVCSGQFAVCSKEEKRTANSKLQTENWKLKFWWLWYPYSWWVALRAVVGLRR